MEHNTEFKNAHLDYREELQMDQSTIRGAINVMRQVSLNKFWKYAMLFIKADNYLRNIHQHLNKIAEMDTKQYDQPYAIKALRDDVAAKLNRMNEAYKQEYDEICTIL